MRTCFFQKNPSKKGVRKTKKVSIKKNSKKMKKNVFEKTKQKFSFKGEMFFSFFQKKRVSKLSVFENGHFWLCPQISITLWTSPHPHDTQLFSNLHYRSCYRGESAYYVGKAKSVRFQKRTV